MADDIRFFLYGRDTCPFCSHAEDYFMAAGKEYYYHNYVEEPDEIERCKDFYGHPTVPIIVANNKKTGKSFFIGGYTDLMEYIEKND